MRFRLRTLLLGMTAAGALCGLFFACPLVIEAPLLVLCLLVSPAVWIVGALFGKGAWRPFFVGGIAAGWAPYACVTFYTMLTLFSVASDADSFGEVAGFFAGEEFELAGRVMIALAFLFPGLVSFLGGGAGVLVYRWCGEGAKATPMPQPEKPASRLSEPYVLIESRVTPLAEPSSAATPAR